jgi:hypothetical protein
MYVFQFLSHFLAAPHVEVVEASLPERPFFRCGRCKGQRQLPRYSLPSSSAQRPRNLLFEHLQHFRWRAFPRFAHQQVHMFRHHHITDQPKTVTGAYFVKDSHESVAHTPRPQMWMAPVTTESNKMQVAISVISPKRIAHRRRTRTLKPEGCGTRVFVHRS